MSNISDLLDEHEIRLIGQLADSLDRSGLNFLELDINGLRVSFAKTALPELNQQMPVAPPATASVSSTEDAPTENIVAITAPAIGFFRAQNSSGLTTGTTVNQDTTIGVISRLNADQSVSAGFSGVISEICVENNQFVEYGQILCRVRAT